jgi:hypothetical protein
VSLGVLWVRKEVAKTAACSIWRERNGVRWISERGKVELLRPWTVKTDGVVHVGAQVEGKASPGHPRRLATLAASSCVHSRMRAALLARQLRWTGSR